MKDIETLLRRAAELHEAGQLAEAEAAYRKALKARPDIAWTHYNLGNLRQALGRPADAVECYRRAVRLQPDFVEAHCNLGGALRKLGRVDEAIAAFRAALVHQPQAPIARFNLGNALKDTGRLTEAEAEYRAVIAADPGFEDAHANLGHVLAEQGRPEEAIASYRAALALAPGEARTYSSLLFLCAYQSLLPPAEYLALAKGWERAAVPDAARAEARARVFRPAPIEGRRLRIGYVSGDFWQHSVSYFAGPLFAAHDRTRVEVFAYSNSPVRDAASERLRAATEHWVALEGAPPEAARDRIAADAIDVLIDLSGHTAFNAMGVLARRAAPVQAHYLGFFASTGLTEADYWIGDPVLTPAGDDAHFSESVWRLPRVWVSYGGSPEAPAPAWRPSPDGRVCFGSFNDVKKLTPSTLALWARVLRALPGSRLLLKTKSLADPANRRRLAAALESHGIPADAVEMLDQRATPDWRSHMAAYDRVDIALDPVGAVGGGTTTCDALWMGAPVVTLAGDRMASRMTASMLDALGRSEWIARSEDEYVALAARLAADVPGRAEARRTQRERMACSPLCDAAGLARSLEDAAFGMFQNWRRRGEAAAQAK